WTRTGNRPISSRQSDGQEPGQVCSNNPNLKPNYARWISCARSGRIDEVLSRFTRFSGVLARQFERDAAKLGEHARARWQRLCGIHAVYRHALSTGARRKESSLT